MPARENVASLEEPHEVLAHMVKQAESGDAFAMERLGSFYQKGGEGSKVQAVRWLEKAARAGRTGAMTKLAMLHLYGGKRQDEVKAVEWLRKASDAGVPVAMNELGRVLQEGRAGQGRDAVRAADLFEKAAAKGHAPSMVNLGAACLVGRGVPKDAKRAKELVSRAAASGDEEAVKLLAAIEQQGGVRELVRGASRSTTPSPETPGCRDQDGASAEASSSSSAEAQITNKNGRAGHSLSSPTSTGGSGTSSLPWRPMRISALPVFGGGGGVDDGVVTPNGSAVRSTGENQNGDFDELDEVPDIFSPAASAEAVVATRPKRAGKKSGGEISQPSVAGVGPDEADAAQILSRQFSLIDEVLTSSRSGAKGILEPEVHHVSIPVMPDQEVASSFAEQAAKDAMDEAVRKLIHRLDTDDPADRQGARELPSKNEDYEELKFEADVLAEAAKRGHYRSQYWLAQCLLSRNPPGTDQKKIDEDASLAIKWLRVAAENGHGLAACQLGSYYQDGRALVSTQSYQVDGEPLPKTWSRGAIGAKNHTEAIKWLEIGARATHSPPAMWRLAQLLMTKAVSKRDPEAGRSGIVWAERAGNAGMGPAAIAVARAYLGGADGAAPIPGVVADYTKARQWANKVPGAQELANYAARLALYSPGPESTTTTTRKHHSSGGSNDFASSQRGGGKRPHTKASNAPNGNQSSSPQSPHVANSEEAEVSGTATAVLPSSNTNTLTAKRRRRRQRAKMQQQQMREKKVGENASEDAKAEVDQKAQQEGEMTAAKVFGFGDDNPQHETNESLPVIFKNHKNQQKSSDEEKTSGATAADNPVDNDKDLDVAGQDVDADLPDRLDVQIAAAAAAGTSGAEPRRASLRSAWRLRRQRETTAAAKTAAAAAAKRTLSHRKRDAAGKRLQESDDFPDDLNAVQAAEAAKIELLKELDDTDAQAQEKRAKDQRRRQASAKSASRSHSKPMSDQSSPRPAQGADHPTDNHPSPMSVSVTSDEGDADRRQHDVDTEDENDDESDDESLELLSSLVAPRYAHSDHHQRGTSSKKGRVEAVVSVSHDPDGEKSADQQKREQLDSPATAEANVAFQDDEDQGGEWQTTVRQRRREKRKAQQQTSPVEQQPSASKEPSAPVVADADLVASAMTADDAEKAPADGTPNDADATPATDGVAAEDDTAISTAAASSGIAEKDEEAANTPANSETTVPVAAQVDEDLRSSSPAKEDIAVSGTKKVEEEEEKTVSIPWGDESSDEEDEVRSTKGWGDESSDDEEKEERADAAEGSRAFDAYAEEEMGAEETKESVYYDDEEYIIDDMNARAAAAAASEAENEALALELARKFESDDYGEVVDAGGWIPAPNKRSRRKGKRAQ